MKSHRDFDLIIFFNFFLSVKNAKLINKKNPLDNSLYQNCGDWRKYIEKKISLNNSNEIRIENFVNRDLFELSLGGEEISLK